MKAEQFEIKIEQDVLDDVRSRLERTRFAPDFANEDWSYGTNREWLGDLVRHWLDDYDWRTHEREMNQFTHHRVVIDDVPIHYLHERGKGPIRQTPVRRGSQSEN